MKKTKKPAKAKVDPNVEQEFWEEYTYTCPKRGKVTERVKVRRFKSKTTAETTPAVSAQQDVLEKIEEEESLSIYSTEEMEKTEDDST